MPYTVDQLETQRAVAKNALRADEARFANLDNIAEDVRANHAQTILMRIAHYRIRVADLSEAIGEMYKTAWRERTEALTRSADECITLTNERDALARDLAPMRACLQMLVANAPDEEPAGELGYGDGIAFAAYMAGEAARRALAGLMPEEQGMDIATDESRSYGPAGQIGASVLQDVMAGRIG